MNVWLTGTCNSLSNLRADTIMLVSKNIINPGFSLKILVAGERCNVEGEYYFRKRLHVWIKNSCWLLNVCQRILLSKQRILWSVMSNEHPVYWYVMYVIEVFIFASTLTCPWFSSGDKKRRDVVQCIVHVPKYDFYIIASQKGIICQWSSKVSFSISFLFLCVSYDTFPVTCESWLHQEYIS